MRSIAYDCYVDGCDASRRSGQIFCGAHWHRLGLDGRGRLSRAARALERREQALDRYGWTLERQDAVDIAGERLAEAQASALNEVEALENVGAAA